MQSHNDRTRRKSGEPDPVARVTSTDLHAHQVENDGENDATISAEQARKRHASGDLNDADLAAGEEFIQMKPNDFPEPPKGEATIPDELTPRERAAEPPAIHTDNPVDEAAIDSFPASDPPSFTPTRAGRASADPVDQRP